MAITDDRKGKLGNKYDAKELFHDGYAYSVQI